MKKLISTTLFFGFAFSIFGQINIADSTMQVIGYWSKGEKQTYHISQEKYKVNGTDTTARQMIQYAVDVTVKDSTDKTYLLEWHYKDFKIDSENEMVRKLGKLSEDIKVLIESDEYGSILGVKNWKEVSTYMAKVTKEMLGDKASDPTVAPILEELKRMWGTKDAIEANAINDAEQFYTYHGGQYAFGEEITAKLPHFNNFGGEPIMADAVIYLDEINAEDGDYVIRMVQTLDSEQLTNETYNFLKKMDKSGKGFPPRNEFPDLTTEISTATLIHGNSGWVIYSVETKVVEAEGIQNVEERIIDLQ
jgi:hypothetical protein